MQVSLYLHVWQAILMFVAGLIAVACSFVGFLRSGGGEQLLQQALMSFLPTGGRAAFDALSLDLRQSKLTVYGLSHSDIVEGGSRVSGLRAEQCEVGLDLWPRPAVTGIQIRGLRDLRLEVEGGFFQQQERSYPKGPPFPIVFEQVDCVAKIGHGPALTMRGCGGILTRGPQKEMRGEFSLRELNGQPFNFRVACLPDGRWELRGSDLSIDTSHMTVSAPPREGPAEKKLDPVELLLRSLLTGESGAKGTASLDIVVQPAAEGRPFACNGQVAYRDLELRLPSQQVQSWIWPKFLEWIRGSQAPWPRLLAADSLRTGPDGRLAFHMYGNRLEFACDEGPGSALVARREGVDLAPLESFKGCVWTDSEYRPKLIAMRGFLGGNLDGELRMERTARGGGRYELVLEPRVVNREPFQVGAPLWRLHTWLEDWPESPAGEPSQPVLRFLTNFNSTSFQEAFLLPPGMRDFSGSLRFSGQLAADRRLVMDEVSWENGGLAFGVPQGQEDGSFLRRVYGPAFGALQVLWGRGPVWRLQGIQLKGRVEVSFDEASNWLKTKVTGWKLAAGSVIYEGRSTDLAALGLELDGECQRDAGKPGFSSLLFRVRPTAPAEDVNWSMSLIGVLDESGNGVIRFEERNVPLKVHPERGKIDSIFVTGPDKHVFRKREVEFRDGQATIKVLPLE